MSILDPEVLLRVLGIIVIDLTVSGENALVIALAVRNLPEHQRRRGRIWGTAGAVVLRLLLILIVSSLLGIPYLRFLGGVLLVWIAVKLVSVSPRMETHGRAAGTLR